MTQQRDGPSRASMERARAERHKLRQRAIKRGQAPGRVAVIRPSRREAFDPMAIDSVRRSFAPDLAAPAAARRALDGFRGQLEEDVIERSALVVSEFVTNSVTHAALTATQPIDLNIQVGPGRLRIEVTDEGTAGFEPVATLPHPDQNSGRGFWIVDRLTDRWGVDVSHSTCVWCEFDLDPR